MIALALSAENSNHRDALDTGHLDSKQGRHRWRNIDLSRDRNLNPLPDAGAGSDQSGMHLWNRGQVAVCPSRARRNDKGIVIECARNGIAM